jgi:restriction endonuclease S subunit
MVLVTMSGTVGNATVALENWKYPINTNQDIAKIETSKINPYFFATFLNSKYGYIQMIRLQAGAIQQHLYLSQIEKIIIPRTNINFQNKTEKIVKLAHLKREQSQTLYRQAEELLLETIGLKNFTPSQEKTNIKSFKKSFLETGRLDAEYYQPKFDILEEKLLNMPNARVAQLVSFINHGKQPPYFENGTVRVFSQKWIGDKSIDYSFLLAKDEPFTSQEFADQYNNYVAKKNDILYYSVGANLGYCHNYLIDEPIMPGSFITLIRANDKINPLYLGFVLNSKIGRMQAEKRKSASAQPYIYPKDISKFIIPIIDSKTQQEISALIQKSFALHKESEKLLVEAKEMVEKEIEK